MTLGPRRKHEPCVAMDGTKCIMCGQLPNNYEYHLKVLGLVDGNLVWEGTCPKHPAKYGGDHQWVYIQGHPVCQRCGVAKQ